MGKRLTNEEILMEIYRRMFKEAEPSADIDKIIKSGEGKTRDFFMRYYLEGDRQQKIIEDVCIENKRKSQIAQFHTACMMGSSPTESRDLMLKERGIK